MKSQKNKLTFNKFSVTELNLTEMHHVNGGGSSFSESTTGVLCDAIVSFLTTKRR